MRSYWLLLSMLCSAPMTMGQFGETTLIDTTDIMYHDVVSTSDLDGDGHPDLLLGGRDVTAIFRGQGGGQFAPFELVTSVGRAIACEDINGDGIPDLIMVRDEYTIEEKLVWRIGQGAAHFGEEHVITGPYGADDLHQYHFKDLEGDGDLDVLTMGPDHVRLLHNDGTGTFEEAWIMERPDATNTMHIADVNGDGHMDLLYGEQSNFLMYHLGLPDGTVGEVNVFDLGAYMPQREFVDIDQDGDDDLVAGGQNNMWVFLSNVPDFHQSQEMVVGGGYYNTPVATDIDLDGDMDIVTVPGAENMNSRVYRNNNGMLSITATWPGILGSLKHAAFVDLDADGRQDVVSWTDSYLAWHPNLGSTLGTPRHLVFPGSGYGSFVDIDNDGVKDLFGGSRDRHGPMYYMKGEGGGLFSDPVHLPDIRRTGDNPYSTTPAWLLADVNADGSTDVLLVARSSVTWHANMGAGQFGPSSPVLSLPGDTISTALVVDVDVDGLPDLVIGTIQDRVVCYKNTGGGTFSLMQVVETGGTINLLQMADLNGDGSPDLVVKLAVPPQSPQSTPHLLLHLQTEEWNLGPPSSITVPIYSSMRGLIMRDMDGDGDLDMVYGNYSSFTQGNMMMLRNNGDGSFLAEEVLFPSAYRFFHLADLDLDGDLDIVFGSYFFQQYYFWRAALNDGQGAMQPTMQIVQYLDPLALSGVGLLDDIDGDGAPDAILYGPGKLYWSKNYFGAGCAVRGSVFLDHDGDAIRDTLEPGVPWLNISMEPHSYDAATDGVGNFDVPVVPGAYQVACPFPDGQWEVTNEPAHHEAIVTETDPLDENNDFGIIPMVDTSIVVTSLTYSPSTCGDTASFWISYANHGTRYESGTVTLLLDTAVGFLSSEPPPNMVNGTTLVWEFDSLIPFGATTIHVLLLSPGVEHMGTAFSFDVAVNTEWSSSTASVEEIVQCAYDPNDKQVHPAGYGEVGAVDIGTRHLDYTVRFQNTGSAAAHDVVIRDPLPAGLLRSGLQVLGYSHLPSSILIGPTGELVVRFAGIMLPDSGTNLAASQGFIKLRFALEEGLPHLFSLQNTAGIYFDLNPPIITNTTVTTLVDCGLWQATITSLSTQLLTASEGEAYQWFLNDEPLVGDTAMSMVASISGSYTVQVTSIHGCVTVSPPHQVTIVGVEHHDPDFIGVVPNPFSDGTRLIFVSPVMPDEVVEIVDVHGRVVGRLRGTGSREVELLRGDLSAGLFIARSLRNDGSWVSTRLLAR